MFKTSALSFLKTIEADMIAVSKDLWAHPEVGYQEKYAVSRLLPELRKHGFAVEEGYGGVPTAFRASFGSGHPVVGLLAEYDALPGLSQDLGAEQQAISSGAPGHGCGHCLMGAAHLAAAIALKKGFEESKTEGTVVLYGCPAEELLTGKSFMARGGAFRDLDFAISWHPGQFNGVQFGKMTALNAVRFYFTGKTAHAAGDPYNGRSALDAVELMNVGANYLREHVTSDVRLHYIIENGGTAPNIVPDQANSYYFIRAMSRDAVVSTYERLKKIAEGAALMTETSLRIEYLGGCYDINVNEPLCRLAHEALGAAEPSQWSEADQEKARKLNALSPNYANMVKNGRVEVGEELATKIHPLEPNPGYGSTDVGDVSYIVPTVMFWTASENIGAPGHSWQIVSCAGDSIGQKGMFYAVRTIIEMVDRILKDPSLLKDAQEAFAKQEAKTPYICPITPELKVPQ